MQIKVNSNAFVKLPNLLKVSTIKALIDDFSLCKEEVKGNVTIKGDYYLDDEETTIKTFAEDIPFSIVFSHDKNEFTDIDITNFEYFEIDNKGIETSFDLVIDYTEKELVDCQENKGVPTITPERIMAKNSDFEESNLEKIKTEISNKIDEVLSSKIEVKEDNLPTKRINSTNSNKKTIKVCFFKNEEEIDEICSLNKVSIDEVLQDANNSEYINKQRLFIKR